MDFHRVSLLLLQICFLLGKFAAADISINCGSSGAIAATNGRAWIGDALPEFPSAVKLRGASKPSTVVRKKLISADDAVPYATARVSLSQFAYKFQVNRGQKIVRLHFNPATYKGFKGLQDLFAVEAGDFTLLSNFSASLTAKTLGVDYLSKEFSLCIKENQTLGIKFSPAIVGSLLDTYAFINGIEIISVPSRFSHISCGEENGLQVVGQKSLVYIDDTTALEVIHKQNIKHDSASVDGLYDMFGMGSTIPGWEGDLHKNVAWKIPVDVGFRYLIRLHFSRVGLKMVESGGIGFEVLIGDMIAYSNTEMIRPTDGNGSTPGYKGYILMMKGNKQEGKRDLLKGFEIFKLSNPDNSLAAPNPLPVAAPDAHRIIQNLLAVLGRGNIVAAVVVAALLVGNIVVHHLLQIWEASCTAEENMPSARAQGHSRRFSLAEIRLATRNFSDELLIGKGGFGKVYKGLIDDGQETVAIKRLKSNSQQGVSEFLAEIESLSKLRHVNLVSLIGYCKEKKEMILVYEYMAGGTLADHLYKLARESGNSHSLRWKQRLDICIGASRGLDYLHTGHSLIHRDVKTSNILLDENFIAKVSDFGLARQEDQSKLQSHVSTKVKGTYGYLDPYYFSTRKLTRKSDVYAFGVVLLETLCERPAVDSSLPEGEQILTWWAQRNIGEGKIDELVASSLRDEISQNSLKGFLALAERCLQDEPKKRPTMAQVVLQLESVLEQQDNAGSFVSNRAANDAGTISQRKAETNVKSNSEQQGMASSYEQTVGTRPHEQTNGKMVNAEPSSERKTRIYKPIKLSPWEAFLSIVKPSKLNEFAISEANLKFDWGTIVAATNRFSPSAQCGSGSVYKGVLPNGRIIAVKRISPYDKYDDDKFINEVLLLRKLGHRNIVRPFGYCIHKEERIAVYEFMERGSLETFTIAQPAQLEWRERFKIITGIARALLYLHHDSGLEIIHGHMIPKNILLDSEMNPKIAGIRLRPWENSMITTYVDRNIAYMCPEYAQYGRLSFKADVYSFGIILLEILTGNIGRQFTHYQEPTLLLDKALKLWKEGKAFEVLDESLGQEFPAEEALRCIQVCLMCSQEQPQDRPDIQSVVNMLEGDDTNVTRKPWPPIMQLPPPVRHTDWILLEDSIATFEYDTTMQR